MADWKAEALEAAGPVTEEAPAVVITREDTHNLLEFYLKDLGITVSAADLEDGRVDVDGVEFYIGPGGLWGHIKCDSGEHSHDAAIKSLADAGLLLLAFNGHEHEEQVIAADDVGKVEDILDA